MRSFLLALAFVSVAFSSPGGPRTELGDHWVAVAASKAGPAFLYQVVNRQGQLHYHVLPAPGADLRSWALQLWVADPRVIEIRKALLQASKQAVQEHAALLRDPDHQSEYCQAGLKQFLESARSAQSLLSDYDPFNQSVLYFQEPTKASSPGLEIGRLHEEKAENGTTYYSGGFTISKDLDVAHWTIPALSIRLSLVPSAPPRRRAVKESDLARMALVPEWSIEDQLQQPSSVVALLPGNPLRLFKAGPKGYSPAYPAEVRGLPCYGAEGHYSAPQAWEPASVDEIELPDSLAKELRIYSVGPTLGIVAPAFSEKPVVVEMGSKIHGMAESGWSLLDGRKTTTGFYLLFSITSESRPGSPSSYCGAGEEADLVWIRLDPSGNPVGSNTELVGSCFHSLIERMTPDFSSMDHPARWILEFLSTPSEGSRPRHGGDSFPWMVKVITYDPAHPERGLWVEVHPKETWDKDHPEIP